MNKNFLKDIVLPLFLFIFFFVIQVTIRPPEIFLAILALFLIVVIFLFKIHHNEPKVFLLGFIIGIFIEVILAMISRQQFWDDASFFGVPLWLPISWGIGFVVITRVGMKIEGSGLRKGR